MLTLVYGGSGSGKSQYAESLACLHSGEKLYLAAMEPFGEEAKKRVERHRAMRREKGFRTVEQYRNIKEAASYVGEVILLECLSNLLANEMFGDKDNRAREILCRDIVEGITALLKGRQEVIIVTNDIFSSGEIYGESTEEYQRTLGILNRRLAAMADRVVLVRAGIPVCYKGSEG